MAKNRFFLAGILGIALVFGLVGCNDDSGGGDNGGNGDGGGTFDAAKLEGTWQKLDVDELFTITFGKVQGGMITFDKIGMPGIKGNILGYGDNTCELAFSGDNLVISKSKGDYATAKLDGTYKKSEVAKLKGPTWQKDGATGTFTLKFKDSTWGGSYMDIDFEITGATPSSGTVRNLTITGKNVIKDNDGSFSFAFEGEKLKISGATGSFATFKVDGTYTKK